MKTILCYGDSLTWGYSAVGPSRHAYEDRWPSVLQAELGGGVRVIAEGLNGRTTAFDDHLAGADRNGALGVAEARKCASPLWVSSMERLGLTVPMHIHSLARRKKQQHLPAATIARRLDGEALHHLRHRYD